MSARDHWVRIVSFVLLRQPAPRFGAESGRRSANQLFELLNVEESRFGSGSPASLSDLKGPDATTHFERLPRHTPHRTYRFFSVALAVLPRTLFAAAAGFNVLAGSLERAAATFVGRTPG
jgi:hypothetical protein